MSSPGAVAAGFSALARGRLILLLTSCTLILGALSAAPLAPAMADAFAGTLAGDHLIRNHPEFAPFDAFDFVREKSAAIAGARQAMVWAALLGVLLQVFFAGGIVETLGRDAFSVRESRAAFWAGSRRHFFHNLKCFALFALLLGISLGAWLGLAGALGKTLLENVPPHTAARGAWGIAVFAGALWIVGALTLLYDFARAGRRATPGIGAIGAFRAARRRLRGRGLTGLTVLLFWTVVACAALAILFAAAWGQRTASGPAVAVNLALLLLLLAVRPAARVAAWGSILSLFDESEPRFPPLGPRVFASAARENAVPQQDQDLVEPAAPSGEGPLETLQAGTAEGASSPGESQPGT